jgi:catechol 2,3-dioxygenase-like lactoylglutathione lyase family enzyme
MVWRRSSSSRLARTPSARIDLTLDCADPARLAAFWKLALGYVDEPSPAPFVTREEWLREYGDPGDTADDGAWLHDPAGTGPRLSLLRVPEPKTAKNRLHIDIRVAAGTGDDADQWATITAATARLAAAGATVIQEYHGSHIVLADPEGNEFCVA